MENSRVISLILVWWTMGVVVVVVVVVDVVRLVVPVMVSLRVGL